MSSLPTATEIGALLRKRREWFGWSQHKLAAELDIKQHMLSKRERGLTEVTATQLIQWCAELRLCVTIAPLR